MTDDALFSLSPLDGRYAQITAPLRDYFSEAALIKSRLQIEIKYLIALSDIGVIRKITEPEHQFLNRIVRSADLRTLQKIKQIEFRTHHDVKAIEYYLREIFQPTTLKDLIPFIHFATTSEDVNNLAYALMVKSAHDQILLPQLKSIISDLGSMISNYAALPMLARTHGQPAIPTTLGKEIAVFGDRLLSQLEIKPIFTGKLNGAVGNYQAHLVAYPKIDWPKFATKFIRSLGLTPNSCTTQINPPDNLIQLFQHYHLINSISIGLCQDLWRYISDDWLIQKGKVNDVGSSTMPQKINPIEFENAEGNLTLANGLFETFIRKLPISRLQRDLSDSTVNRNFGVAFGHCLVAYHSLSRGLKTLAPNPVKITTDLNANYAILGEALQTVLRHQGQSDAYESVAKAFKQKVITQSEWQKLVKPLAPELINLTPSTYLGLSTQIAINVSNKIDAFFKKGNHV
jgi:adenylosuccinate lyase